MYQNGLRSMTGKKVCKSRMYYLLSNPFYCSQIVWKGKVYKGKNKSLIADELFFDVQNKLNRKIKNPHYQKHYPVFKAKINCGVCYKIVNWELQKGHWYGCCKSCKTPMGIRTKYIRQEEVEKALFQHFDNVAPKNKRFLRCIQKILKYHLSEDSNFKVKQRESLERILRTAEIRMEKAYLDKLTARFLKSFVSEL